MNRLIKFTGIFLSVILALSFVIWLNSTYQELNDDNAPSQSNFNKSDQSLMDNVGPVEATTQREKKAQLPNKEIAHAEADALNGINIMYPPSPLVGCVGDGIIDDTKELQAIIDYCAANEKALIIPEGGIFRISQVVIANSDRFTIYGYGTLKRIDNAPYNTYMLHIKNCDDLVIPILHTDGNVDNNLSADGIRVQEDSHSIRLRSCNNVSIGSIYDVNPIGDGVYIANTNELTAELISVIAKEDSGRNALSIISGNTMVFDRVISTNIGIPNMPGGIDIEPNEGDEVYNVTILDAVITTRATGLTVTAGASNSVVDNVYIQAKMYRDHSSDNRSPDSAVIYHATNVTMDVDIEGNIENGVGIYYSDGVNVNMNISDVNWGLSVYDTSNFNITGAINNAQRGAIRMRFGMISNGVFDMVLSNSNLNGDSSYGKVHIYENAEVENITFKGDYSKEDSGEVLFMNNGTMSTCRMVDLDVSGFSRFKLIRGSGVTEFID